MIILVTGGAGFYWLSLIEADIFDTYTLLGSA